MFNKSNGPAPGGAPRRIMVLEIIAGVVLLIVCSMFFYDSNSKAKALASAGQENKKLLMSSNALVQANDTLSDGVITDEIMADYLKRNPKKIDKGVVREMIKKHPEVITGDQIEEYCADNPHVIADAIDKKLADEGVTHNWKRLSRKSWQINSGKVTDYLIVEKCGRCGVVHKYWENAGLFGNNDIKIGFFFGGEKLGADDKAIGKCRVSL